MTKWMASILILPVMLTAKDFKGAELRTKLAYTYGRFEVNYQSSRGAGQTSTFFTYHELGSGGLHEWNELDIEILGRYENDVQFNSITPDQVNHVCHQWVASDPSAGFHTYAIEWTPEYVAWFIDNIEVRRQTGEHIATLTRDQKIMMNIWPPAYSDWVGDLDLRMLPFRAYYDWVSYASYTPGSGNVGTGDNFTHQWRDDFDTWDTNRWAKATHTWNGNNCDFIHENCVFQDGKMILCLTDNSHIGLTDNRPPFIRWARFLADTVTVSFSEKVTAASAENPANFRITGITIETIQLQPDQRTVKLKVSGMNPGGSYNLAVLGIKDASPESNTLLGQSIAIQMPPQWVYPLRINVGGAAWNGWLGDQDWDYNTDYGHAGGGNGSFPGQPIDGTVNDLIYQTEQWGIVGYHVRLPVGCYTIRLLFAENYFNASGMRIFDINLENHYLARNLDIYAAAGSHTAHEVVAENVMISDGVLDIHFGAVTENCFLNGITIEQVAAGSQSSRIIPRSPQLLQNFPNPFNAATRIRYALPETARIILSVHDLQGALVAELVNGRYDAGRYEVQWNAAVPSGVYLYRIQIVGNQITGVTTRKMMVLK